ncbi:hypothetical protein RA272_27835, partial [Pseudomonas syringae pv. tagetis]|uniref:hypothetical protein n=1 Tax=Pseudomonas syringae group genomosp. 7 TaxID=251699 RepID=UPI00376F739A
MVLVCRWCWVVVVWLVGVVVGCVWWALWWGRWLGARGPWFGFGFLGWCVVGFGGGWWGCVVLGGLGAFAGVCGCGVDVLFGGEDFVFAGLCVVCGLVVWLFCVVLLVGCLVVCFGLWWGWWVGVLLWVGCWVFCACCCWFC